MNKMFSPDEIVEIYELSKSGKTVSQIAKKLKHSHTAVSGCLGYIQRYVNGDINQKKYNKKYLMAAETIKDKYEVTVVDDVAAYIPTATLPSSTHYLEAIEKAQEALNQAVATFVQAEVQRQVGEIKAECEVIKEENIKLHEVVDQAKKSNLVHNLTHFLNGGR